MPPVGCHRRAVAFRVLRIIHRCAARVDVNPNGTFEGGRMLGKLADGRLGQLGQLGEVTAGSPGLRDVGTSVPV
jgi:hypothetical protein